MGLVAAAQKPVLTVQVRQLVEFALRTGDLGTERDFVGPQRALAGIRGQHRLQRARPAGYQKEVRVVREVDGGECVLRVQGRIDGLLESGPEVLIEEIKTVQGGWNGTADLLHWAQARVYGAIYGREHGFSQVALQLTYLDLDSGQIMEFRENASLGDLERVFEHAAAIYLDWLREQLLWERQRDASLAALQFPFRGYRAGQRDLAVAVYRAIAGGGRLFVEAPTGIGKTISVLFPAVKAMAEGKLERIFYLTARTSGRAVAEKALADLRPAGARLRSLSITAKDKICFAPGQPCDGSVCAFARGYYDRLKPALRAGLASEEIARATLEKIGRQHQVCPFELSLDLSLWVDVVVCDYNYLFDPRVYLRRHFGEEQRDYAFLVDEAHNLVDRGREMFSAALETRELHQTSRAVRAAVPRCARALSKLARAIRRLASPAMADPQAEVEALPAEADLFVKRPAPREPGGSGAESRLPADGAALVLRQFPSELVALLEIALKEAENWLGRNEPAPFRQQLLELYFQLHSFRRTVELYDERFVAVFGKGKEPQLRLLCLDPSFLLRQALERGKAAIFFSATLSPTPYYREVLGGSQDDRLLQLASPFAPENLAVLVHDGIGTHYKARSGTLADVAAAIGAVVQARAGNYLAYFPSYQYLSAVHQQVQALGLQAALLVQRSGMSEPEREEFLEQFRTEHEHGLLGFAVMGGAFGEAIDLLGEHLVGAVIVGVGLPQLCLERDLIRDYFQERTGSGFDYAYTFPGMNRVLQATGRVIRSENDRGAVLLIDCRFGQARYLRLFPPWWKPVRVRDVGQIRELSRAFWAGAAPRAAKGMTLWQRLGRTASFRRAESGQD